jgi:hypothetical protein
VIFAGILTKYTLLEWFKLETVSEADGCRVVTARIRELAIRLSQLLDKLRGLHELQGYFHPLPSVPSHLDCVVEILSPTPPKVA